MTAIFAGVLLEDDAGRLLLQHRTADAPYYPSTWGAFGGGAEGDETPGQAAVREIGEELGLQIRETDLRPICVVHMEPGDSHYFAAPLKRTLDQLRLMEGDDMQLFSSEEIADLDLMPNARIALEKYFDMRKHPRT